MTAKKIKTLHTIPILTAIASILFSNCSETIDQVSSADSYRIIFLHHSTGNTIWEGNSKGINLFNPVIDVPGWFADYNVKNGTNYFVEPREFPKEKPYGWSNYPYDYYNIWVKNGGDQPFMEEPTLEILTKEYKVIIFKHCFPVGYIEEDKGAAVPDSKIKTLATYKVQYNLLKEKLLQFPETKFILWTAAALNRNNTTPVYAERTKQFVEWVKNEWDTKDDNIYLWDFYELETEGGLYLSSHNARSEKDSHPGKQFAGKVVPLFCQRIVDVIETKGQKTALTGVFIKF